MSRARDAQVGYSSGMQCSLIMRHNLCVEDACNITG
jgi:hypothetical protein